MLYKSLLRKALCVLSVCVFATSSLSFKSTNITQDVSANNMTELQQRIEENRKRQEELEAEIKSAQNDKSNEKKHQEALSEQIEVTQNMIKSLNEMIDQTNKEIEISNKDLEKQEKEIKEQIEVFKKRIRAMYLSGDASTISILLGADDFYDALMKLELVKRVANYDNDLIDSLLDKKQNIEKTCAELETKKIELEKSKDEYEKNRKSLDNMYTKSQSMIDEIQNQEKMYKESSDELKKQNEEFEKEIQEIIRAEQRRKEEERKKREEEERKKREEEEKNNQGTDDDSTETSKPPVSEHNYAWPVPGYTYISSYFGYRWGGLYGQHRGIDIAGAGISGAPIVASKSGEVIVSFDNDVPGYSYGKYIIIIHDDGTSTVYGHASKLAVSVGDYVKQGQTIAYVGTTGFSTGYHLHFEIRIDGVAVDPYPYL